MNNQAYNYASAVPQTSRYTTNNNWNQRVRPVASLEEVKASPIDFDGSVFFFPDFGNKRIYTKFITVDGIPTINMYELKEMPVAESNGNYITREEFEEVIQQLKMMYSAPPAPGPGAAPKEEKNNVSPFNF